LFALARVIADDALGYGGLIILFPRGDSMSRKCALRILGTSLFVLALSLAGCGGGPKDSVDKEKRHILRVVQLARDYEAATKKKAASLDDVKSWAVKEGKAGDDAFISPRDKQPYGLQNGMTGLLVYEQEGKNGKCFMFTTGSVREVTPGEISRMKGLETKKRRGPSGGV
jgi:hypothetical protein